MFGKYGKLDLGRMRLNIKDILFTERIIIIPRVL